jgi:hypothetical protein
MGRQAVEGEREGREQQDGEEGGSREEGGQGAAEWGGRR